MLQRFAVATLLVGLTAPALAHGNDRGEAKAEFAGKSAAIDYGRPSLKGRDMLAQAKVGAAWRMGADSSTTLTTAADLSFGDVQVPKGKYTLTATKVSDDAWQLNVLSEDGSRVADVPLTSSQRGDSVEMFTIELKADGVKGTLQLVWGTTELTASFAAE